MDDALDILLWVAGAAVFLVFGGFAWTSAREGEGRAAYIAVAAATSGAAVLGLVTLAPTAVELAALVLVLALAVFGAALFAWPLGRVEEGPRVPDRRADERDIMFSRGILQPGTPQYDAYYSTHPEKKESDDRTRGLPGLLSPEALYANEWPFHSAMASFGLIEAVVGELDGPVEKPSQEGERASPEGERMPEAPPADRSPEDEPSAAGSPDGEAPADSPAAMARAASQAPGSGDAAAMTSYITALARYYGAHSAGVATLEPHHFYSHNGQPLDRYGEPINPQHPFAVAFAMEMDFDMVAGAPEASIVMESARNYAEGAKIALELAYFIRSLGHEARAEIVDHYDVLATLVARDAGLGEVGRHGLLITPRLGTRVRLGLVTTDLPLEPHRWRTDTAVLDFCTICKKCAENCPSNSIPTDERRMIDGALRWQIDSETCYRYWCSAGTDCGVCMRVCPYSHPDGGWHAAVRWANERSGGARRAALYLDDLFYGRRPAPHPAPDWIPERPRRA